MKPIAIFLFCLSAAGLLLGAFIYSANAAPLDQDISIPAASEMSLDPEGSAFEVTFDPPGMVWVSDNAAGQIWQVNPQANTYTTYSGLESVSDARHDGAGSVWWVASASNRLGRLDLNDSEVDLWEVPGANSLIGTALDSQGGVWLSNSFEALFYRFEISSSQLCTYTLPEDGAGGYIVVQDGFVWLGDWRNDRVVRLDMAQNSLTSWQLPYESYSDGLAVDGAGNFWWAEPDLGELGRLEPQLDRLTRYRLPANAGSQPEMIAADGNLIAYSEYIKGTLGFIDPASAQGTSLTIPKSTTEVSPICSSLPAPQTSVAQKQSGTIAWTDQDYPLLLNTGGWSSYQLPENAYPWGIALGNGNAWIVQNGRQVLARWSLEVSITACSVSDADGDLNTTGDQSPLPGQTVYLHIDGTRQEPGALTGGDGCSTWQDLAPNHSYAVEQEETTDYTLLGEALHDFGSLAPGMEASHTFVNAESVTVQACSVSDADGDLNITGDQAPLAGQTVYLDVDGTRQEPGALTGGDGCSTWQDLAPNHIYAVEQEETVDYTLLDEALHDFGNLAPGAAASHTFVNAESVTVQACSLSDEDGDLNTTSDQAPLAGWSIQMSVDGQPSGPGQLTGADGCAGWVDLPPNHAYALEQTLMPGWKALTPSSRDFGMALPGDSLLGYFINTNRETNKQLYLPVLLR